MTADLVRRIRDEVDNNRSTNVNHDLLTEAADRLAAAERVVEAARAVRAKYPAHAETADLQMDAALRDYEKAYSGEGK